MIRDSLCIACRPIFDEWIFFKALKEYGITLNGNSDFVHRNSDRIINSPECNLTPSVTDNFEIDFSEPVDGEDDPKNVQDEELVDQRPNLKNEQEKPPGYDEFVCEQSTSDCGMDSESTDDVPDPLVHDSSQSVPANDSIKRSSKFDNWTQPIFNSETQEQVELREVVAKLKGNYIIDKSKRLPYICLIDHSCLRSFVNSSHVENHLFSSFYFTRCPTCCKEFKNYDNMNRHHKKCRKKLPVGPANDINRPVSVLVAFHPEGVQSEKETASIGPSLIHEQTPGEQTLESERRGLEPDKVHNPMQDEFQVHWEVEKEEEKEDEDEDEGDGDEDGDEENKLVPRITVFRLPNFMKETDQPASELDQIYSSFTEWYFRANKDYACRYVPEQELEEKSPIPASQLDSMPQSESEVVMEGNSGDVQIRKLETDALEYFEASSSQFIPMDMNGGDSMMGLTEVSGSDVSTSNQFFKSSISDDDDDDDDLDDQMIEPIVLSKDQNGYALKAKTKKTRDTQKSQRGSLVYQCPFCKFKCNPGHRYATLRHVNGYKSCGKFIKPKCRKRRKLKPADPVTGVYEQIEPTLLKTKRRKLKYSDV